MEKPEKLCGNCIHFKPVIKCSENDVGVIDEGHCMYWRAGEWDSVNRLNRKLPRFPGDPACENAFIVNKEYDDDVVILKGGSKEQAKKYDELHDKRKTYHCNRCGCTWKCLPYMNKFSGYGMNEDPHILCANPECRSDDVKEE